MKQLALALTSIWFLSAPALAEVYATIGGKELEATDEPGNSSLSSVFGRGGELRIAAEQSGLPTDEETLRAIRLADGYRATLEANVISLMAPSECKKSVSDEELAAFVYWWRNEVDARVPEGVEFEDDGVKRGPSFRRELISTENKHALEIAKIVIENWKLLGCIDAAYPGNLYRDYTPAYFTQPGNGDISVFNNLPMPALIEVMPVSAVAHLFEVALQSGRLSFSNETYESVFLARYTTPELSDFSEKTAAAYFATPYWLQLSLTDAK